MNFHKILISLILLSVILQSPSINEASPTNNIDKTYSLQIQNTNRSYLVHLPKSHSNKQSYPLLLVLHGRGGSGRKMAEYTQFSSLADKQNFIVVYSNAINKPTLWNAFYEPKGKERDDITFIKTMLKQLQANYKINEKRIYVVGYSSGAMMTYRIASELSDKIAAIAIISGSLGYRENNKNIFIGKPTVSIPTMIVHGKKDSVVHFGGGMSLTVKTDLIGVKPSVEKWAAYNECAKPPTKETFLKDRYIREVYTCKKNGQIVFYTLLDGSHKWPILLPAENNQMTFTPSALWEFLSKY